MSYLPSLKDICASYRLCPEGNNAILAGGIVSLFLSISCGR